MTLRPPLRRGLVFLTDFAVDTRYPGDRTTKRQAAAAQRWAERVRLDNLDDPSGKLMDRKLITRAQVGGLAKCNSTLAWRNGDLKRDERNRILGVTLPTRSPVQADRCRSDRR